MSESIQQLVRPGKCVDVYYPDPDTAKKQCFRTTQNTRYVQQFANLSGGSSVLTIPPNNGGAGGEAYGRVYAFVMKTPKVFKGADRDIAEMYELI